MKNNTEEFLAEVHAGADAVYPSIIGLDDGTELINAGILLRDKIAIEAMVAIIAKIPFGNGPRGELQAGIDATARGAYAYADAMIKERSL